MQVKEEKKKKKKRIQKEEKEGGGEGKSAVTKSDLRVRERRG